MAYWENMKRLLFRKYCSNEMWTFCLLHRNVIKALRIKSKFMYYYVLLHVDFTVYAINYVFRRRNEPLTHIKRSICSRFSSYVLSFFFFWLNNRLGYESTSYTLIYRKAELRQSRHLKKNIYMRNNYTRTSLYFFPTGG